MIDSNNPTETWNILQKDQYVENLNVPQGSSQEGNIRVVCISDTHMEDEKLQIPDGDILVHTVTFPLWVDGMISNVLWIGLLLNRINM